MPFIGRREQMEAICKNNPSHFILIQGKSGLGKTRLANEYVKQTGLEKITISFKQQERDIPYFAIIKAIKALILISDWSKLAAKIKQHLHPERWNVLSRLVPEFDYLSGEHVSTFLLSTQQILEALEQFFIALASERSSVICIDDIHFADTSSLEALRYLVFQPTLSNVKFIATFRPSLANSQIIEFFNALQKESLLQIVELGQLDNDSVLALLLFYFPDIVMETAKNLMTLADGNPYWVKTIIRGLDSGYTEFSGSSALVNMFDYSLRSLSPKALSVIYLLAVLGESCDYSLFSTLCGDSAPESVFLELSSTNLISRDGRDQIEFSHSKIYEYVRSRVEENPQPVKPLHLTIARAIEATFGEDTTGVHVIEIADHYNLSSHPELCARFAARADDYLLQVDNIETSIKYYRLAIRHLKRKEKFDATLIVYTCMFQLGHLYESNICLQNALSTANNSGLKEYALTFEAMGKIYAIPEYAEIQAGAMPSYKRNADCSIAELLLEAKDLTESGEPNPFLLDNILSLLATYNLIIGETNGAKRYLNEIISHSIWRSDNTEYSASIYKLAYSSILMLINIMNNEFDPRIYHIIVLEEQLIKEIPIRRFLASSSGTKALLSNIQGQTAEGELLMDLVISEANTLGNELSLANALVTQAKLVHKTSLEKSYRMNYEAYRLAQRFNAKYSLVRALIGLVKTSPSANESGEYYKQLVSLASGIGDEQLDAKIKKLSSVCAG